MAALSVLRGYVRDELGELTAGRWSDTQLNSWLNRGVDYLAAEYYRSKCWKLLKPMTHKSIYTLTTTNDVENNDTWSVFSIINNLDYWHSAEDGGYDLPTLVTNYYGFVKAMLGNYNCEEASIDEFHRLHATAGEYHPATTTPYITFWGIDETEDIIDYSGGGTYVPKEGDLLEEDTATPLWTAYLHKYNIESGTLAAGTAAGYMMIHTGTTLTGAAAAQTIDVGTKTDICTLASDGYLAEDHGKLPYVTFRPAIAADTELSFWWLEDPDTMSAATDTPSIDVSDELLVLYAAARAWKADRNFDMHASMWQEFNQELQKKLQAFQEVTLYSL